MGNSGNMKINGILGHDSAMEGYTGGQGTTWAKEMNFDLNYNRPVI